jgi:host factor-I protein
MAHHTETKATAAQPNIQDSFLNFVRRERLIVGVRMMDGQELEGRIRNFDRFAVIIEHNGSDHMVFKHAIASIRTPKSAGSYYSQA